MSWNQQLVKLNNKSLVLKTIKDHGPLSRADISQRLGLTKGTVSSLVNELLTDHFCYETGPGESSGGRRPVMLLFNQTSGYSIGIDLGVNYILGVLTDLNGNIVNEQTIFSQTSTFEHTIVTIKKIISNLISRAPVSNYGVVGIGIGVPGIVNKEGEILLAPNLGWKSVNLQAEIEKEFQLPVIIENEANAGAYGEKCFGAGRPFEDIIYISAGIGIGVGFILNNELYRGRNGFSGEMGHMIIQADGKECSCGSRGCWELYASEKVILSEANLLKAITPEHTLEDLLEFATSNNEIANLFEKVGFHLGIGINNIINTFNPEQIIIGNRLAMAREWLEDPLKQVVQNFTLKQHQSDLRITFAELSIYSAALGVSAYVTEDFLRSDIHTQSS
ncbi:ROK family transcriptional regulator [Anaerobacillus alkaliphilus]|uniref:ROK family transcriptional regulator n=1 Tax=Anaerobacillus alkaliphilus TaxID=1548597 RepID=A0A4Q0VUM2_9BACI|nr:ROK family transcriptional regulator [Anaerobacillus alkaliphilus]RXJ02086.1 ROK family transcriptional regulator [Anaerobacillus alkaliphilus]